MVRTRALTCTNPDTKSGVAGIPPDGEQCLSLARNGNEQDAPALSPALVACAAIRDSGLQRSVGGNIATTWPDTAGMADRSLHRGPPPLLLSPAERSKS
jgi:hypothetical protein